MVLMAVPLTVMWLATPASAQPNPAAVDSIPPPTRILLQIGRLTVDNMRVNDTIPVWFETSNTEVAGFDVKIGFDDCYVDLLDVLPGKFIDSCGWEYFSAKPIKPRFPEKSPPVLWQVVGLARGMSFSGDGPACYSSDRRMSLFRLAVSNEFVKSVPDTTVPIFFFWEDCGDNVFSNARGNELAISMKVFDYFPQPKQENNELFPTRLGAPTQCIDPSKENRLMRRTEFHNGGIEFKLMIDEPPDDDSIE